MSTTVFKIPVPSTAFSRHAAFKKELGRLCTLSYAYETQDGRPVYEQMTFDGVEAFKCTYYTANSTEVFDAYDRVIDVGKTDWLNTITKNLIQSGEAVDGLKHLRVFFDDGPCYEFICRLFEVVAKE